MPTRSKKPCAVAGCPVLTSERWCEQHKTNKHVARSYDDHRGSSHSRGYTGDWRKLRLVALQKYNYLCQECLKTGRPTQAQEVHHIKGIAEYPELRLVLENLMPVCKPCHLKLTAEQEGIFGRKPK